ncbi:MAG TPA: hypothetical protein VIR14_07405 [Gaiellaceae bacterium]
MRRGLGRIVLIGLIAVLAAIAVLAGAATTARADYGRGTQFQVEISANDVHGGNFWFWAALGPGQASDYQNTDCIHESAGGNPGGTNGAAHTSGELTSWSDSNGTIEMDGVSIVGGLATADYRISDQRHSNTFTMIVTSELIPLFPLNVPLTWNGRGVQVQVAP